MGGEDVFVGFVFLGLFIFLFILSVKAYKGRYLKIYNVKSMLEHNDGTMETEKGIVIEAIYEEIDVLDYSYIDEIVVSYKGEEISRNLVHPIYFEHHIKINRVFKKDVELFLKEKYEIMKADRKENKKLEKMMDHERLRKLEEDYKGVRNHY